ncbi:(S)-benzoin forming benzil reductase [Ectobacillus antri]|jgi:benzil reductase ((S)-benzoin forming)|uniref:(S)-benzoin forming benzil reductase n=1 Tax=Ectobacillus antri TaxID=2486280 RepID=UPI000F592765|nr:(S)-benzoin forming benzil reductase [Ectobacillus antri]
MRYAIVTGTSRGLGEAIVRKLLEQEIIVFSISRSRNTSLEEFAKQTNTLFYPFGFDLSNIDSIADLTDEIFALMDVDSAQALYLINNAGMLAPIKPIGRAETKQLITNVHVNLLAPMLLTHEFLKRTQDAPVDKRIVNISSGAGTSPYYGWGAYCTAKAGINMFTRCIALEEEGKEYPVKVISFAPGVVDTDMQAEIRSTDKEDFMNVERFHALKEEDKLLSPDYVAQAVVNLLQANDFEQGGVIRIDEKS